MTKIQLPALHGSQHASNGSDPIPGIGGAITWEDVGTSGAGIPASLIPAFQSGCWYGQQFVGGNPITVQTGLGYLVAMPIWIPTTTTFDRIGVIMITQSVPANLTRLGIYNNQNGNPSTLVLDAGTVDASGTPANREKSLTISQTLAAGIYWLACVNQGSAANQTAGSNIFTPLILAASATLTDLRGDTSAFAAMHTSNAFTSGGLPSSWSAAYNWATFGALTRVYLRAA